jgi:hypothetical protein
MKKITFILLLLTASYSANSQILISILLGDKLNSDKLEFGLDGGWNYSTIDGLKDADRLSAFNLGFYFDLKLFKNPKLMLNTGVIVKSTQGASGLPVYSLNDAPLDSAFHNGSVKRKIQYFNVPIELKYQFKNRIFVRGGLMLGLKHKAIDLFENSVKDDDDLKYTVSTKNNYHAIDAGVIAGFGYRLLGGNGMNLGVQYYRGLVDITIDDTHGNEFNSGLYVTAGIPIGKVKPEAVIGEK